jgi:hypothetical protein
MTTAFFWDVTQCCLLDADVCVSYLPGTMKWQGRMFRNFGEYLPINEVQILNGQTPQPVATSIEESFFILILLKKSLEGGIFRFPSNKSWWA